MNTEKQALQRLVKLVEDGIEKYPMLYFLVKNHQEGSGTGRLFLESLVGYKRSKLLFFFRIAIFSASIFAMLLSIAAHCDGSLGGNTIKLIDILGTMSLIISCITWFGWNAKIFSYHYVNKTLSRFLNNLRIFENRLGAIINYAPDRQSIRAWTEDGNIPAILKKLSDEFLVKKAMEIVLAQNTLNDIQKEHQSTGIYVDLYNDIAHWVIEKRLSFGAFHNELKLYDIADEKWDRYFDLAEKKLASKKNKGKEPVLEMT